MSEDKGEFFRVLKRDQDGWGFAWPCIHAVFRTLNQQESMEVADNLWAFVSRAVIRQFKVGHEIRNGPRAGQGIWFWNTKRGDAIKKFFEGRVGVLDFDGNFDIDIQYLFPSAKRFDRKKYESVFQRLSLGLGPVGLMLLARDTNEFLVRLLRASILDEREEVGGYCSEIMNFVEGDLAEKQAALQALRSLGRWAVTGLQPRPAHNELTRQIASRILELDLLPRAERNDARIVAETSMAGIPYLVSNDNWVNGIDQLRLARLLDAADFCHSLSTDGGGQRFVEFQHFQGRAAAP